MLQRQGPRVREAGPHAPRSADRNPRPVLGLAVLGWEPTFAAGEGLFPSSTGDPGTPTGPVRSVSLPRLAASFRLRGCSGTRKQATSETRSRNGAEGTSPRSPGAGASRPQEAGHGPAGNLSSPAARPQEGTHPLLPVTRQRLVQEERRPMVPEGPSQTSVPFPGRPLPHPADGPMEARLPEHRDARPDLRDPPPTRPHSHHLGSGRHRFLLSTAAPQMPRLTFQRLPSWVPAIDEGKGAERQTPCAESLGCGRGGPGRLSRDRSADQPSRRRTVAEGRGDGAGGTRAPAPLPAHRAPGHSMGFLPRAGVRLASG